MERQRNSKTSYFLNSQKLRYYLLCATSSCILNIVPEILQPIEENPTWSTRTFALRVGNTFPVNQQLTTFYEYTSTRGLTRCGVFNIQNTHVQSNENPYPLCEYCFQK